MIVYNNKNRHKSYSIEKYPKRNLPTKFIRLYVIMSDLKLFIFFFVLIIRRLYDCIQKCPCEDVVTKNVFKIVRIETY